MTMEADALKWARMPLILTEDELKDRLTKRQFMDLFREKRAHEKYHRAAREFNSAVRLGKVAQVASDAARDVSGAEFAALTVRDQETGKDIIVTARWRDSDMEDLTERLETIEMPGA